MQANLLFSPPIVFVLILSLSWLFSFLFSRWAFINKNKKSAGAEKAYACGEEFTEHLIQPDYSQFFPFAFFFTILHVVALMVATVPVEVSGILAMALIYVAGAVTGLVILLRR